MKNSNVTTGNRACDLPICSAVPQIFINKCRSQGPSPPIFLYRAATSSLSAPNTALSTFLPNPLNTCPSKGQQSHLGRSSGTSDCHQRHLVHLLSLELFTSSHQVSSNWMFCFCVLVTELPMC